MHASFWLKTRADAFDLDAREANRLAVLAAEPKARREAKCRADAYRIAAAELRSCANEFPEYLDPAWRSGLLEALHQL